MQFFCYGKRIDDIDKPCLFEYRRSKTKKLNKDKSAVIFQDQQSEYCNIEYYYFRE